MSDPGVKTVHKDSALSNLSIGYRHPMFIADQIFPVVPVTKMSDYFFKFLKANWFTIDAKAVGPGSTKPRSGYKVTSDNYSCVKYAIEHPVPIELINNADNPITPMKTGVSWATRQLLLLKEKKISDLVMTGANWTTTEDAAGLWVATADGSGNTFLADVYKAMEAIRLLIGVNPNTLVMDNATWLNIVQEYSVKQLIAGGATTGNPAIVTKNLVAQIFGLERILVGGAIYNDAEETVAGEEFNAVNMWETNAGKGSAWLGYVTGAPAVEEPSAGYIFNWNGDAGNQSSLVKSDAYREVRRWWDNKTDSWIVDAREFFDEKVTLADAGYHFSDTIAT